MDGDVIVAALRVLGCRGIELHIDKVVASCPNEREHEGGRDWNPSYAVLFDPTPGKRSAVGKCLSCGFKEPLDQTLLRTQFETGRNLGAVIMPLVMEETDSDLDAMARLDEIDFDAPVVTKRRRKQDASTIDEVVYEARPESSYDPFRGSVPRYALERGVTIDTCRAWELGHDKDRSRLLFPVRNHKGELVGVSGRSYREHEFCPRDFHRIGRSGKCSVCGWKKPRKYLHSKGPWRSLVLYGEHLLVPERVGLLVEGNFDAVLVWQAGVRNVVAVLGSILDEIQVMKMRHWWDELWIWGDPDKGGEQLEESAGKMFREAGGVVHSIVDKPQHEDPGGLEAGKIRAVLRRSEYPLWGP